MKILSLLIILLIIPSISALVEPDTLEENAFDEGILITNYPARVPVGEEGRIEFVVELNSNSIRKFELPINKVVFDCEETTCKGKYVFVMQETPLTINALLELESSKEEKPVIYDDKADFLWTEISTKGTLFYLKKFTVLPEEPQIEIVESTPYLDDEIVDKVNEITERELDSETYNLEKENGKYLNVEKKVGFKKISTEEGEKIISVWTIKVSPVEEIRGAKNVYIYEEVPKEGAYTANNIVNASKKFTVLRNDPLIMWHFDEVEEPVEITYETGKASITGAATVVTAESVDKGNIWQIIIPLLLIPFIGFFLIYFGRFKKKVK